MPTAVLTKPGIRDGVGILREVPGYGVILTYSYPIRSAPNLVKKTLKGITGRG